MHSEKNDFHEDINMLHRLAQGLVVFGSSMVLPGQLVSARMSDDIALCRQM